MTKREPADVRRLRAPLLLALTLLGGCHLLFPFTVSSDGPAPLDAGIDGPPADSFVPPDGSVSQIYHFPAHQRQKVDILFVVDNSESMVQEQQALAQTFPGFVAALAQSAVGLPDLHIGVISTDLGAGDYSLPTCEVVDGDRGQLQNTPRTASCTPPSDRYISHAAGSTNVPGAGTPLQKIKSAFSCIAQLGAGGCGFEQTIEAASRAVDPALDINPGFVRSDALLVLIFVTDEDDCSAANQALFDPKDTTLGTLSSYRCFQYGVACDCPGGPCGPQTTGAYAGCKPAGSWLHPISGYISLLKGLKPAGGVVVAALAGPAIPVSVMLENGVLALAKSCQSKDTAAAPGIRLKALLDGFGTAAQFSSICAGDYGPPLKALGAVIASQMGRACLRELIDIDPAQPGLQVSCTVREVAGAVTRAVPACAEQSASCQPCPCWRVRTDASCDALGGHRLEIVRSVPAAASAVVEATCLGPGS